MRLPELYTRAVFIDDAGNAVEAAWNVDSGFKITFTVDKVSSRKPDSAEVTVYNLHPGIQKKIGADATELELYAGSVNPPPLLFKGPVTDTLTLRSGDHVDWLTTVYAEDTKKDLRDMVIGRTYKAGTALKTVFHDLVLAVGSSVDVTAVSGKTSAPLPLLGPPSRLLDEVCQLYGYRYQIIAGVIIVLGVDDPISTPSVPVINALTGLRGAPSSNLEKKVVKITASTGLDATLVPGGLCIIETESTRGSRKAPIKASATYFIERAMFTVGGSSPTSTVTGREYGQN